MDWNPPDDFNILDFRDYRNGMPRYVLKFVFPRQGLPVRLDAVHVDVRGWNAPECGNNRLLSYVQVSKNGLDDIYYKDKGEDGLFHLEKQMVLEKADDNVFIVLAPSCPINIIDVAMIRFMVKTTQQQHKTTDPQALPRTQDNNMQPLTDYWYIYATLFFILAIFLTSVLFLVFHQKKQACTPCYNNPYQK